MPTPLPASAQAEYAEEGLAWTHIDFADNQPCLDLIDSRGQLGLLHLLDQQCAMPTGTDATFALELRQRFETHASFAAPQLGRVPTASVVTATHRPKWQP